MTAGNAQLTSVPDGSKGAGIQILPKTFSISQEHGSHKDVRIFKSFSASDLWNILELGASLDPEDRFFHITAYIKKQTHRQEVLLC